MKFVFSKSVIICFVASYMASTGVSAQTLPKTTLSGYIFDESTDSPLAGVNVFLNNTSLGAASRTDGYFIIKNVPIGTYELVVSMMGYHMEKRSINLNERGDRQLAFKLKPKVLRFRELEVVATRPKEWLKNLKKFEKLLLGTSKNASKCKIINPEILDFKFDKSGDLSASASDWLTIENWALGYTILFNLQQFIANENGEIFYLGETQFKTLTPKNEEMMQKWENNRLRAYHGSIRHFFRSLLSGKLKEEGFLMHKTGTPKWRDIENTFFVHPRRADMIDSLSSSESSISLDHFLKVTYSTRIGREKLLSIQA